MAIKDEVSSLERIAKGIEEMARAEGAGIPTPTESDAGKVRMVGEDGKWKLATIPSQLPAVADTDAGKVLTVSAAGEWEAEDLPS